MLFGARMPLPSPRGPRRHPRGCVVVTLGRGWGSTRNRPNGRRGEDLGVLPGVMGSPPESRQDEPRQVGGTRRPASAAGSDGDHDCHGDGGPFWGLPGLHIAVPHPGFPLSFRAIPRRSRRPSFWECCRFFSGPGGQGALVGRGGILGTGLTERGRQQEFSPGDWPIESGLIERVGVEEYFP